MASAVSAHLCYSFSANAGQFSGSIFADPQASCMYFGQRGYNITGYSSTNSNFTLMGYGAKGASDNCLIMPSTAYLNPPLLDHNGITFRDLNGGEFNFYYDPISSNYSLYSDVDSPGHPTTFSALPCGVNPLSEQPLTPVVGTEHACAQGLATEYTFKATKGIFVGQITIDPTRICNDTQDSSRMGYNITVLTANEYLTSGVQTLTPEPTLSVERPDYCFFPTPNTPHLDNNGIGLVRASTGSGDVGNNYILQYYGTETFGYSYALLNRGPANVQAGGTDFEIYPNCASVFVSNTTSVSNYTSSTSNTTAITVMGTS